MRPGFLYLFDINLIDSKNFILSKLNVIRSITKAPEFRKVVALHCPGRPGNNFGIVCSRFSKS